MPYDPAIHHRRSVRFQGYDYSRAGAYFVTICTHRRACLFGEVVDEAVHLNQIGQMVQVIWDGLPNRFAGLELDVRIVLPNHLHGILLLDGTGQVPLGQIIGAYKSLVVREYAAGVEARRWGRYQGQLWQRNYYEHIVRHEAELSRVREYIVTNPMQWELDEYNPHRQRGTTSQAWE